MELCICNETRTFGVQLEHEASLVVQSPTSLYLDVWDTTLSIHECNAGDWTPTRIKQIGKSWTELTFRRSCAIEDRESSPAEKWRGSCSGNCFAEQEIAMIKGEILVQQLVRDRLLQLRENSMLPRYALIGSFQYNMLSSRWEFSNVIITEKSLSMIYLACKCLAVGMGISERVCHEFMHLYT